MVRHQPPQSADAIRQEQIKRRFAAAVADIHALIAGEQLEHRINVFAGCREDAHRVQVEGGDKKTVTREDDGSMYAPCHLEGVTWTFARHLHPLHCREKRGMPKGPAIVL